MLAIAATTAASAETGSWLRFEPEYPAEIRLTGTSTLHDWEVSGTDIHGSLDVRLPGDAFDALIAAGIDENTLGKFGVGVDVDDGWRIGLRIPVQTLQSSSARMRRDLMDAIGAKRNPFIYYEFKRLNGSPTFLKDRSDHVVAVKAKGTLTLAGKTKTVVTESRIRFIDEKSIEISGRLPLNMLDFGIDPPTAFFGLLRAHADFDVLYRFQIKRQPLSPDEDDRTQRGGLHAAGEKATR